MAKINIRTGVEIDGFLVGKAIHTGGMARLWEVTRASDDTPMLMKVPILREGEDPAVIVSFEMEQMIMPRLQGPHVPRFIANGQFSVQPYIVMERISGPTLLPQLENLPFPVDKVAQLGIQIAAALDSLHRQHVVHLDLKPSNIMFRPSGEAVLIDYGLSHHRELPDLMAEEFRLPYGTAPYMAPEQVLGVRNDPRSDIFALGVLMYFFASDVRPFCDPQKLKGLKQRLWRDPVPLLTLKPGTPPWFQEIVLRCLEVNAARRPQTASHLAFDLKNPSQVELTERSRKVKQDSFFAVLKRKSEPESAMIDRPAQALAGSASVPIIMVAVDLNDGEQDIAKPLHHTVQQILARLPNARLACVNVLKLARIALDSSFDEDGNSKHLNSLMKLKNWVHPLGLGDGRATFHVLEAIDPAEAILEFARTNNVDQIIMGARANSTMRKILGSVSGRVAAEAPCTVTVVRNRGSHGINP